MNEIVYDEVIEGHCCKLHRDGTFTRDGIQHEWFKDSKTSKPWIPKRRNFISLVKQMIRDDEFED